MAFKPNFLSQRDPRWMGVGLGFDDNVTIGTDGCTLVCLAMLVNGYGFNETPDTLNAKLRDLGPGKGFQEGLIVWTGLSSIFHRIAYQKNIVCRDQPAPLESISQALGYGQPLLVEVDYSPSPGLQGHWVILTSRQGDDFLILDPWPFPTDSAPVSLAERYGFGHPLDQVITAVVWYQNTAEAVAPTTLPLKSGMLVCVQASVVGGLRLRSEPSTRNAAVLALEPPGTQLSCLEPDAVVQNKLGVPDQWLQVVDPGGVSGYVAARYLSPLGAPTPGPTPVPPAIPPKLAETTALPPTSPLPEPQSPAATGITVYVSQNVGISGLRMRRQPYAISGAVTVVPASAELTVLEPENQALSKIGQPSKWLNVMDKSGKSGYVAAWYIELKPGTARPPDTGKTAVPAPGAALMVTVSSKAPAGLRLRDLPDPGASTIKILPAGTRLTVLDDPASALARLGKDDQWLNVKEQGGQSGFVSARYVEK